MNWAEARRILVMRLDNIGDVIMTGPALRAIRETVPHGEITLLASPAGSQATPLLPWVNEVIPRRVIWQEVGERTFDPADEWRFIDMLRERSFDAAIIFTSFSQSPHPAGLLCLLAGIPLRLGESREIAPGVLTHAPDAAPDEMHQAERNLRLVESVGFRTDDRSLGVSIPHGARRSAANLLQMHGIGADDPYLLLNPWTSAPARNYAPDRFAAAARELVGETGWRVVVSGVERNREQSGPLLEGIGPGAIGLIGQTDLPELAALVAGARLVLTSNTSVMHLADALRVPMVVPFAGTELECQWQPRHAPARLLRRATPCAPCHAFTCSRGHECLDIPPSELVAASRTMLEQCASR